jgi:hypothetical protein
MTIHANSGIQEKNDAKIAESNNAYYFQQLYEYVGEYIWYYIMEFNNNLFRSPAFHTGWCLRPCKFVLISKIQGLLVITETHDWAWIMVFLLRLCIYTRCAYMWSNWFSGYLALVVRIH